MADLNEVREMFRGELKTMLEDRDQKSTDLGEQIEHLKTKSAKDAADIMGRIDGTSADIEKLTAAIDAHEKKMAAFGPGAPGKTLGQQFVESDEWKSKATTQQPTTVMLEMKDILNSGQIANGVSRSVLVPEQQSGLVNPPTLDLRIRSLIPAGATASNSIRSIVEKGFTNNAAVVAEGGLKPKSELTFGEEIVPVEKIAHRFRVSMEVLDDAPMMRSYIDGRGRYGLLLKEEDYLLNGSAAADGLLDVAKPYAADSITDYTPATLVDDIRVAKLQVRKALYPASGVVLNPEDWAAIELLKSTEGSYLFSSVTSGATPTLWGMPVVQSDSMPAGTFLVGAFSLGAQIWDRMGMTVRASTEDGDNFSENMVTILFEKRLALEVNRPEAFVHKTAA
ncbi:phage major capsid protein [Falsirhodobacter halotolerans]|uniref:phage major capsid protein n=1 Tax=Falsirhodobacter halotolerans TaxID=1146892 RepID=UPI001FD26B3D|nr:phage major capsid protein [Falsirhodobacter halotolerans]MCJ8138599.1 phage major capsid protein [Falsirhodobacter halotolerans]